MRRQQLPGLVGLADDSRTDQDGDVATAMALGARAGPVWKRRRDVAIILNSSAKHGIRQFYLAAVLEYLTAVLESNL